MADMVRHVAAPKRPATIARPAASDTTKIPLGDAVDSMDPQEVWQNFYALTQIPRPSHYEQQVAQYLADFGRSLGLETIVDDTGNVLIRKPAAPGLENRHGVVLQAHMDMVPQAPDRPDFDFTRDPIEAYVDGPYVDADRTTLGADDGIGVALAMAVLQSAESFGPVEALFTVNEEAGMDGARGLKPGLLQGDILINLDSETEGEFTIGCAGGEDVTCKATFPTVATPAGTVAYTLTIGGLRGGHSGVDINLGRGHATKLLVRVLRMVSARYGVGLAGLTGGTASNAIPTTASAVVVVPETDTAAFESDVRDYQATLQNELAYADPGVTASAATTTLPDRVLEPQAQQVMIDVLYATPQGVMRMSDTVPGLVETSTNMGIASLADGLLTVASLMRSSVDSELRDLHEMMASVWELAGVEPEFSGLYAAWQPNPDSPIVVLMESVYQTLYGKAPNISAIHAGLEVGVIIGTYPDMDAISIGPTLLDVHTANEKLQIDTVRTVYDLLFATLRQIPVV